MSAFMCHRVEESLSNVLKAMFDCECWSNLASYEGDGAVPEVDDLTVCIVLYGEDLREIHLRLGFSAALIVTLLARVIEFNSDSREHHKLMESAVEEIGNIVASKMSIDYEVIKLIGQSEVQPPLIYDLLETKQVDLPFETGEKSRVDIGEFCVDIFLSYVNVEFRD